MSKKDNILESWIMVQHFNLSSTQQEITNCRMKALLNLETDATNLHSFFIEDLQKAKTIQTNNLDDYISGRNKKRVDLESRIQSKKFNSNEFNSVL